MKRLKVLTETLQDQDHHLHVRVLGTIFILMAGIMPFVDTILSVLNIESSYIFGFTSLSNYAWALCQCISPMLLIIGFLLKPYLLSFLLPIYSYSIQILWIFDTDLFLDDPLLHVYAFGACFIFALVVMLIFTLKKKNREKIENDRLFIKEMEASIELLTQKPS